MQAAADVEAVEVSMACCRERVRAQGRSSSYKIVVSHVDRLSGVPSPPPPVAPLYDPYVGSPQAVAQVLVGRRRQRVTLAIALAALATALGSAGVLGWGLFRWHQLREDAAAVAREDHSTTKRAALEADDEEEADDNDSPVAKRPTTSFEEGSIEVVDLGAASKSLGDTLRVQLLFARAKGQTMIVMLTGSRCAPCRGVDDALSDPAMQQALRGARLVRVDLDTFGDELAELDIPTSVYPAFFLLDQELRPLDAIHGGEWDEDIAENIAPVLGAFVRGEYRHRRQTWSPTTSSIRI